MTTKHLEQVSMAVLFLMEAAQKADHIFGVRPHSSAHAVHDASEDILIMTKHLLENNVVKQLVERKSPSFIDPTENGWKKLTVKWIKETLERTSVAGSVDANSEMEANDVDSSDVNYSLADTF